MANKKLLTQKLAQKKDTLINELKVLSISKKPCDLVKCKIKKSQLNDLKKDYIDLKLSIDNGFMYNISKKHKLKT